MRRSAVAVVSLTAILGVSMIESSVAGAAPVAKKTLKLSDRVAAVGHPVAGSKAGFKLSATVPAGDKLTGFAIDYGDHTKVVKGKKLPETAAHLYGRPGRYTVTLTVTDEHHKAAKTITKVLVGAVPVASGAGSATTTPVTAPAPPCDAGLLYAAAASKEGYTANDPGYGPQPDGEDIVPGVQSVVCDADWAVGWVVRPVTATEDSLSLFRVENGSWVDVDVLAGDPSTLCRMYSDGVPLQVQEVLIPGWNGHNTTNNRC